MIDQPSKSLAWVVTSRLVVASVVAMIFIGGMVTSLEAGMAVPDWPLSFGSVNPPGWWRDELVFWEHFHRLFGAYIGLCVIAMLVVMMRAPAAARWRWLGWIALGGVIFQGVLGGVRVLLGTAEQEPFDVLFALFHGCVAQAFFCLTLAIAVLASPPRIGRREQGALRGLFLPLWILLGAVFVQLVLGATIRHFKWSLAIPDFPLSMGQWVPPFTSPAVAVAFAHRAWAFVIAGVVFWLAAKIWLDEEQGPGTRRLAVWMVGSLVVQIALGATVIWTKVLPVPTTFHVLNGALFLGIIFVLLMRSWLSRGVPEVVTPVEEWVEGEEREEPLPA